MKFIFLFLAFSVTAQAQLMSTFVREQTGTLPRGRFMISMVGVNSSVDRMYDRDGVKGALSSNFEQNITFGKISSEEAIRGNQLSGLFLSNGVKLDDSAGTISGEVNGKISGKVPVVGYGITDDLGVFLAVPIIEFQVNSTYRFTPSATTAAFLAGLRDSDQVSVANEFQNALDTSLEYKLYQSSYDWDPALHKTYVGDLQINLLKLLSTGREFKSQVQGTLILPTSNDRDLRDLYGLRAGEHRFGLGAKYSAQQALLPGLQLNGGVSAQYLFSSVQSRRLPKNADDDLNELVDASVSVSGGASYHTQAQLRYAFPRWLGVNVGLDWQQRFADQLQGSAYAAAIYADAQSRSGSSLFSTYASLDLNSIPSFLDGDFVFPAIAELGVGLPIAGRNAIAEPVIQIQGTMFF